MEFGRIVAATAQLVSDGLLEERAASFGSGLFGAYSETVYTITAKGAAFAERNGIKND